MISWPEAWEEERHEGHDTYASAVAHNRALWCSCGNHNDLCTTTNPLSVSPPPTPW